MSRMTFASLLAPSAGAVASGGRNMSTACSSSAWAASETEYAAKRPVPDSPRSSHPVRRRLGPDLQEGRGLSGAAPALRAFTSVWLWRSPARWWNQKGGLFTVEPPDDAYVESGALSSLGFERLQQLEGIPPRRQCLCGG